jgi:integrase/recombinase XerD
LQPDTGALNAPFSRLERHPALAACPRAEAWFSIQSDLGLAPRTLDAYARGLASYFVACRQGHVDPLRAGRAEVAHWVRELNGLANATVQQRLVAVRLFYDYLVEEGLRESNPVGRGRYAAGRASARSSDRGFLRRETRLPWLPTDQQWRQILDAARSEPVRNRLMLAMAYDAALRREELCSLCTDDLDPAHRTLRVRAETTKNRRGRVLVYSATTGALLHSYLAHRRGLSRARGPLFLSESRRNLATPITLWTWSKVVRAIALRAGVPRFSTHTLRHLCLTDLARAGWELHSIAAFAGHRSPDTTLQYIHLSGRDLAARLADGMAQVHSWRLAQVADLFGVPS